jgi:hypothetical protein
MSQHLTTLDQVFDLNSTAVVGASPENPFSFAAHAIN